MPAKLARIRKPHQFMRACSWRNIQPRRKSVPGGLAGVSVGIEAAFGLSAFDAVLQYFDVVVAGQAQGEYRLGGQRA